MSLVDWVNFAAGAMTLMAAVFAFFTVRSWRKEHIGRRKLDLIEEAIISLRNYDNDLGQRLTSSYCQLMQLRQDSNISKEIKSNIDCISMVLSKMDSIYYHLTRLQGLCNKISIYSRRDELKAFDLIGDVVEKIYTDSHYALSKLKEYKSVARERNFSDGDLIAYINDIIVPYRRQILGYTQEPGNPLKKSLDESIAFFNTLSLT